MSRAGLHLCLWPLISGLCPLPFHSFHAIFRCIVQGAWPCALLEPSTREPDVPQGSKAGRKPQGGHHRAEKKQKRKLGAACHGGKEGAGGNPSAMGPGRDQAVADPMTMLTVVETRMRLRVLFSDFFLSFFLFPFFLFSPVTSSPSAMHNKLVPFRKFLKLHLEVVLLLSAQPHRTSTSPLPGPPAQQGTRPNIACRCHVYGVDVSVVRAARGKSRLFGVPRSRRRKKTITGRAHPVDNPLSLCCRGRFRPHPCRHSLPFCSLIRQPPSSFASFASFLCVDSSLPRAAVPRLWAIRACTNGLLKQHRKIARAWGRTHDRGHGPQPHKKEEGNRPRPGESVSYFRSICWAGLFHVDHVPSAPAVSVVVALHREKGHGQRVLLNTASL